jgi:parvulin-like peptidyl-prolyl isomerase
VIEAMIVERAQLQLAKEMGVRVDDRELDAPSAASPKARRCRSRKCATRWKRKA